jgi:mannose-6-phosphate isomerase-like protein (cupin superfamily)
LKILLPSKEISVFALVAQIFVLYASLTPQAVVADPPGFVLWSKGIPDGGPDTKVPFANHTLSISHRDKNGLVEEHEKFVDVIVVQSGNATLIVGGDVLGPKSAEPGEIRGKSIRGGLKRTVGPGDVIHITAGTPHQFLISPGSQITSVLVSGSVNL